MNMGWAAVVLLLVELLLLHALMDGGWKNLSKDKYSNS